MVLAPELVQVRVLALLALLPLQLLQKDTAHKHPGNSLFGVSPQRAAIDHRRRRRFFDSFQPGRRRRSGSPAAAAARSCCCSSFSSSSAAAGRHRRLQRGAELLAEGSLLEHLQHGGVQGAEFVVARALALLRRFHLPPQPGLHALLPPSGAVAAAAAAAAATTAAAAACCSGLI